MDYVYLKPAPEPVAYSELDKVAAAPGMIDIIERGALDYKGFEDGDRLGKIDVCSIICGAFDYDLKEVSALYDEIEAEKKVLEAIHPCGFATITEFKAALSEVSNYITVNTWVAKLQEKFGVSTWAQMLTWCSVNYNQEEV